MSFGGERFITEMPRAMHSEMSARREDVLDLGLRMTAMEQRLLGIDTHMAALQHGAGGLTSGMRRVKERLELVDGNDAR